MKFLTLATLVLSLGITSCSKDRENDTASDDLKKNVFLKIEKPTSNTRAESKPEAGGTVDFNKGYLYFTASNGFIEKYYEIIASGTPTEGQVLIDDLESGYQFKNLPVATSRVYVVGNTELDVKSGLIAAVRNTSLMINSQEDFKNVNLYGTNNLQKVNGTESEYTTEVLLAPTVSRLEINGIKSKGNVIESFEVEGVFVDNWVMASDVEGTIDEANIITGGDNPDFFQIGTDIFPAELNKVIYDWYFETELLASVKDGEYQTVKPTGENSIWAYNVFAKKNSNVAPTIVIRLINVKYAGGKVIETPLFLTAKLKNITELEPGKIYTIGKNGIIFDETNLSPDPNAKSINAEVIVTLAVWDKVDLDIEF